MSLFFFPFQYFFFEIPLKKKNSTNFLIFRNQIQLNNSLQMSPSISPVKKSVDSMEKLSVFDSAKSDTKRTSENFTSKTHFSEYARIEINKLPPDNNNDAALVSIKPCLYGNLNTYKSINEDNVSFLGNSQQVLDASFSPEKEIRGLDIESFLGEEKKTENMEKENPAGKYFYGVKQQTLDVNFLPPLQDKLKKKKEFIDKQRTMI